MSQNGEKGARGLTVRNNWRSCRVRSIRSVAPTEGMLRLRRWEDSWARLPWPTTLIEEVPHGTSGS